MTALLVALIVAALPEAIAPPPSAQPNLLEPVVPVGLPREEPADELSPPRHDGPPRPRDKTYLISAVETGLLLVGGTWWYWSGKPPSSSWDLRFDWDSWRTKIDGTAFHFDADLFETNASSHTRAGLAYYQVARGNGLSYGQSYLWTFAASFLWEYVVEWNEFPSINDAVLTPAAGVVVGEGTYRLGRFFAAGEPTVVNRLGAALFSPFATLNDLLMGREPASESPYDVIGFTSAMPHWFLFGLDRLACFANGERQDQTTVTLDTALVSYRGYRRPGRSTVTVHPGDWTELGARLFFAEGNTIQGMNLHSSTLVVGRYIRRYAERAPDETWRTAKPRGWGAVVGLGSAFDYDTRDLDAGMDKVASAGLLGPTAEVTADRGGFGLRLALSSYYSFALVQSMALLVNGNPITNVYINSTLRNQGYYFAQGSTSVAALDLRAGMVELTFKASFGAFWSLNGRDRFEDEIEAEVSPFDIRASGVAIASVRPLNTPLRLAARVERILRSGHAAGLYGASDETRAGIGAGFVF